MYKDYFIQSVLRDKPNAKVAKAIEDAKYQKSLYSGNGQDEILLKYREKESINQKEQRKRITISRTKHITKQIENVLNQLDVMDKPAISVFSPNENVKEELSNYIYNYNIDNLAFELVKYYNLIDANAFLTCRQNQFDDIEFQPVESTNLYDYYIYNNVIKFVIFKFERMIANKRKVYDYELYYDDGIMKLTDKSESEPTEETVEKYYYSEIETNKIFSFRLGYLKDSTNEMKTCVSLLDSASQLFKSLIWQGSDMDVDIATHGIIQKFAYAQKCNYSTMIEDNHYECVSGYLYNNGAPTANKCSTCAGSGLQIHTTNQDIITFPLPDDGIQSPLRLSDLSHTIFAPTGTFEFKDKVLSRIKDEIMETVFNATVITKSEIAATATEKVIDLQGIYATLNQLGKQVSECFIWMMECVAEMKGYNDVEFIHGYTLNLKLESVESLSLKRKALIDASAPIEVIKALDMAILQKQHIDSPQYLNRFVVWERYRPFSEKSDNVAMQILAGLPNTNKYKVLYNFWGKIKMDIETKYGDDFFDYSHERRVQIIDDEVKVIISEIESQEPQRFTFNG